MSTNTVTQEQVNDILQRSTIEYQKFGNKTLVSVCTLPNGFVLVEDASCVDPANFCEEIGKEIIIERLTNKVWELEGYKLQSEVTEGTIEPLPDKFGFDQALSLLKAGFRVTRSGWNGSGMFAYYVEPASYPAKMTAIKDVFEGDMVPYRGYFALKTAQNDVAAWVPSGSDILAEDWQIAE